MTLEMHPTVLGSGSNKDGCRTQAHRGTAIFPYNMVVSEANVGT